MSNLKILENESLKKYNTYRIDSKTKYLVFPETEDELIEAIEYCQKKGLKFFILGNGSNVILSNKEFSGMVINTLKLNQISIDNDKKIVTVSAGVLLPKLCQDLLNNGLVGLEWASGIPGTIGGAIYGNAGAYLAATFDYLIDVKVYHKGNVKILKKEDIKHGYRDTFFKNNKEYIILSARLQLNSGDIEESKALIEKRKQRRVESQPLEYPSAGSVFRNPDKEIFAGKLIEDVKLKGKNINDAKISEKHGNFIINEGNATFEDITKLIKLIKKEVKEKNNIDLICEQEIIDWD